MTSPLQIFARKKRDAAPLAMISLYDAPSAQIACDAGVDALLVGDSLGNSILGYDSTIPVTMEDMKRHTGAVVRGVRGSSRPAVPVVADLPFGSYATPALAVENAVALLQIGAHAVKIEGVMPGVLKALVENGVPVMGHLGFTPQSVLLFEGVVQGKTAQAARELEESAQILDEFCFAVVLEAVTAEVAQSITRARRYATVGIGAGAGCDGQVLVWNDLVGLSPKTFKLAKAWANTRELWLGAAQGYIAETQNGAFPTAENSWNMSGEELEKYVPAPQEEATLPLDVEPLNEQPF